MCGRYTGNDTEVPALHEIYLQVQAHYPSAILKHGEIFPTDTAPILFGKEQIPVPARWGYPSRVGKGVIINARAETAAQKASFRESLLLRRCAVPTTGYLEWDASHTKYHINRSPGGILYLAGFCCRFADGARFVILTTTPNDSVRQIHSRMPVILDSDPALLSRWNGDTDWALAYLRTEMPVLCPLAV